DTKSITITKADTATTVDATSTSYSEQAVNVTLSATVSATSSTVNAGTVTFQLKQGSTNIGTAVTSTTVVNGAASVTYSLPAGTSVGSYTIAATYNPSSNFGGSYGSNTLT